MQNGTAECTEVTILDDWEQLDDEKLLDKQLKSLVVDNKETESETRINGSNGYPIIMDPTFTLVPPPQIKILKRPVASSTSNSGNNGNKPKSMSKTLEEKEAEYDRARQRILGTLSESTPSGTPLLVDKSYPKVEILKTPANGVVVTRSPKVPDNSNGFKKNQSS
ncbi:SUZ RNA-binding domain-containing-like [Artemia franciscana]|uniref:SUZ domain-containing protein n=1 Tax=Artemia franciscana TaxID=6661 RepID=A0AA88L3L0_ARTSF|nr:hypothetical protein QYM36_016585 [Artemia franciscana]